MSKYQYNSWPLGKLPPEFQRTEPQLLRDAGYEWEDPRDIVDIWERKVSDYWGAKYAVATDCCSHAIFLSLMYCKQAGEIDMFDSIIIPKHTYISVPMQVIHANLKVRFRDYSWEGYYQLNPSRVVDAAVTWEEGGYIAGSLMCLSFQIKKAVPVGKMGTILTDDPDAFKWLKLASYDGRDLTMPYDSEGHVKMIGWHMYATPEDCARAILLMDQVGDRGKWLGSSSYPDVSQMIYNI